MRWVGCRHCVYWGETEATGEGGRERAVKRRERESREEERERAVKRREREVARKEEGGETEATGEGGER